MTDQFKPQENKLLSSISIGINSLAIACIIYIAQLVTATSIAVTRSEENIKSLTKQGEAIELKLDASYARLQLQENQIARLQTKVEQIEGKGIAQHGGKQ
ncbi:hypothetical protein [Anabaena lutea]|uniref:Uncharacterized protein n=1 Tax=Anabaena lutea FACHB-196 TaxID=2692881 RepID=A0ABR8FJR8_9NOST|nr:hypothetical protein [Anabaena lutea]MBD2570014.1 hypothetical protein [Anabaena lutea FACHB-196]